jgi:hypothetical protein
MSNDESVAERLARIETKLDQALTQHSDHETRIRKLERALWTAAGFAAAGGGAVGALVSNLMGAGG